MKRPSQHHLQGLGALFLGIQSAGCGLLGSPCATSVWVGIVWHLAVIAAWLWATRSR